MAAVCHMTTPPPLPHLPIVPLQNYACVTDVYARGVNVNLTPLTSNRGALATDARGCSLWRSLLERPPPAPESRVRDPLRRVVAVWTRGSYIGAVTRMGVRFRGVNVTDVYARGVNVNLTPLTSNRGALATDVRGCSLWLYLLERPPPAWESRVRDPLGTRFELGWCGPGRGCYMCMMPVMPTIDMFWREAHTCNFNEVSKISKEEENINVTYPLNTTMKSITFQPFLR